MVCGPRGVVRQVLGRSVTFALLDHSEDDAEQHQDGTVDVTSSDLEMVNDGSTKGDQLVGLRFRYANLPQGVSMEKAFIQFSADEENSQLTQLNIHSEAADDAAVYSVNESISVRGALEPGRDLVAGTVADGQRGRPEPADTGSGRAGSGGHGSEWLATG